MAYLWHDRALLMVNGVACAALMMGILRHVAT
jgi:type IV secretory pathway TrbD component